jgi:hypothetical protein
VTAHSSSSPYLASRRWCENLSVPRSSSGNFLLHWVWLSVHVFSGHCKDFQSLGRIWSKRPKLYISQDFCLVVLQKQTLAELVVAKKEVEVLNMTVTWIVERE